MIAPDFPAIGGLFLSCGETSGLMCIFRLRPSRPAFMLNSTGLLNLTSILGPVFRSRVVTVNPRIKSEGGDLCDS